VRDKAPIRVAIVTNVIPHYRRNFYRRIFDIHDLQVHVFCQKLVPGLNLNVINQEFAGKVTELSFLSLTQERAAWQFLPFGELKDFDVIVLYGNPRVFSSVILSLFCKLLAKPVVIWGQAHTSSSSPFTERLRLAWWRLFNYIFVYNEDEVTYLTGKGFEKQYIVGMNNGLDQDTLDEVQDKWSPKSLAKWQDDNGILDSRIILSVARLEQKNEFDRVIIALSRLREQFPDLRWVVIGAGSDESRLKELADEHCLSEHIIWLGAVYDEHTLCPWFLSAVCLVHPGSIGLSLLHAFGYGLPVITHDNPANHMPEFAALRNGWNGLLYAEEDPTDLHQKVSALLSDAGLRAVLANNALTTAQQDFNTGVMAARFEQIIRAAASRA